MPKQNERAIRRRKPGRPGRMAEERIAAQERRIAPSFEGRLKFRPGDPHVLDIQEKEARNYRALLVAQVEQLQATHATLDALDDPGVSISQEENALKAFLWETYRDHKHRDHIAATFLAIRRQRLLARLQAATDALQIATDLLQPGETLFHDMRRAVEHLRQEAALRELQSKTEPPMPARQDQDQEEEEGPHIDNRHIYGDLVRSRAQLAEFDSRVQAMRAAISPAIGWFEEFYVKKVRYTAAAREFLKRDEPIPADVQATEDIWYGPYLKYRWQEIVGGPMYTVQMSLIPDEELQSAKTWAMVFDEDQGEIEPWPTL